MGIQRSAPTLSIVPKPQSGPRLRTILHIPTSSTLTTITSTETKHNELYNFVYNHCLSESLLKIKQILSVIPASTAKLESDFSKVSYYYGGKSYVTKILLIEGMIYACQDENLEKNIRHAYIATHKVKE